MIAYNVAVVGTYKYTTTVRHCFLLNLQDAEINMSVIFFFFPYSTSNPF